MTCPKCGFVTMSGPRYCQDKDAIGGLKEWLLFRCPNCGFEDKGPTRDSLEAGSSEARRLYEKIKAAALPTK